MLSREYAALVCLLEQSSFRVTCLFATKDSDLERTLEVGSAKWLTETDKVGQAAIRRLARARTNGTVPGTTACG